MSEEKKINDQQESGSPEQLSLNDDRRVKVLSPGTLVAKRFFRNRLAVVGLTILAVMFIFSFIGGLISPYGQDEVFYRDDIQLKEYAAMSENTEYRYLVADGQEFGTILQAQLTLHMGKDDSFSYKGVTYDSTTYTVVTTVSDNGDGTLTATHKLEGTTESAGFTNKYHAMPTQVSIGAVKVLEGRELKKDEFSFKLVGEDIESTVTNDADGKLRFDKFEYNEPGACVYTISEVKGDEAGMTYDKSVFTATVNVVDDGEGNLKANVVFTKGDKSVEGIVFNNTYEKPETPVPTPDPGTPKTVTNIVKTVKGFLPTTGDQQAAALLMAFVIAMAGVGALVWGFRKR